MIKSRIKLGYAPTRRDLFSAEEALHYKDLILERIKGWNGDVADINDINTEGLLFDENDVGSVVKKFKQTEVDALFFPHCNFGTEDLVAKVAKEINKPVLIWGPRDGAPLTGGIRTRDSQCGMFATGKVLRRFRVPFTYLNNSRHDGRYFEEGFKKFLAVANVVKEFRRLRILQISTRPAGFWSVMVNESELLEKFGIGICPVTLDEVVGNAERIRRSGTLDFIRTMEAVKERFPGTGAGDEMEKIIALKCSIREISDRCGCTAAAVQCWTSLQRIYGIMPCFANSLLSDEGLPCACETDIHGAISAILLQAACMNEKPHFFGDVTIRHPEDDNAELLWHCGTFPPSLMKDPAGAYVGNHWILRDGKFGTCEWEIAGGDITLTRFDGDNGEYRLFIGEGKGVDGPFTRGTYLWFKTGCWPKWERKLVKGPYIHHLAGIHGKVGEILLEACSYIPGLIPDPAEPSLEELEDRWMEFPENR